MNQEERELFFYGKPQELLKEMDEEVSHFSPHGNPKRSLVGLGWYYVVKNEETGEFVLYKDEIIKESEDGLWLKLHDENNEMINFPVFVLKEKAGTEHSFQSIFKNPMDERTAQYLFNRFYQKRSTTIESVLPKDSE